MPTRRNILELLAAAPLAACAGGPSVDPVAAWRNPGAGETDPRRYALAHAILAPNPHNRQPWVADLVGGDEMVFFADTARLLPATDPPNRQITLGCGAFLELLDLAARQSGHRAEIALWPEGEPQPVLDQRPVARIRLVKDPGIAKDPLFAQILKRHTNRVPFEDWAPAAADLAAVVAATAGPGLSAATVVDPATRAKLIDLGNQAFVIEGRTHATHMESVNLMRIGADEIARHRDGISLDGPLIGALSAVGMMTKQSMANPDSFASKQGVKMYAEMLAATPAFFWLRAADNSRASQIAAGRAYARAHLTAAARGLSMHPWSMGLQEFPEMAVPYAETQALLGATPAAPLQMLTRIGYAKPGPQSPRRGLEQHIRT